LRAITNGVFLFLRRAILSIVYFSNPCIKSITKMAKSQRPDPLDLRFANDSCPGVSITSIPGAFSSVG